MFAWILKTNPENVGASGDSAPAEVVRCRGWRRQRHEVVQERLEPEVGHGAAEEDRRHAAAQEELVLERVAGGLQQRQLVRELVMARGADGLGDRLVVERAFGHGGAPGAALGALEVQRALAPAIVDAEEALARSRSAS